MKKLLFLLSAVIVTVSAFAQEAVSGASGGVKAKVVSRADRTPIVNAELILFAGTEQLAEKISSADGTFEFAGLTDGNYRLKVSAAGFTATEINFTVEMGEVRDLMFVTMVSTRQVNDMDDSSFAEFDMEDSGYSDVPTILFGSNDIYSSIAGYGFSAIRFKNRGYNSETQDVYLAGIRMNDALTGYSPYSLWSGLNEAMRSKETSLGVESLENGIGGYNGMTNILATPSSVRPGWRFSILSNSALYRLRLMATYASGELDNGWSYAFNVSARLGGNDWVQGVYYRSFAYYLGVEKKFGDMHKLSFMAFAALGQRGAQNASTQEVYDLMGDNMYNSNWGYQDGKLRNSRVRKTHEPVFVLKYTGNPLENLETTATVLYRTGKNGYTALDWYDASDPRPDYYRNLPSYFYNENSDYDRNDPVKAAWAEEAWRYGDANMQHVNWDRLYNVNYNSADGRSKYGLEERRVDQNDLNGALSVKWMANNWFTLNAGGNVKYNRTEYYKKMDDLLGGQYYLNIDQFAERDFASNPYMIQNDLDYYIANGEAEKITKGGKYGYDYFANVVRGDVWAHGTFETGGFRGYAGLQVGGDTFWREGMMRKGMFAGLDDNGQPYTVKNMITGEDITLTTYDHNGNAITSKGRSARPVFLTYSAKLGASYYFQGGHRIFANAGFFNDAPTFNQSFVSPRTRNSLIPDLSTTKTLSADINWTFARNGFDIRLTGFYTKIWDQTDMMSFYDDSQNSFTNFAMSGIDQRHAGLELGFKIPLGVKDLFLQGVVSWGEYIYTSNPYVTQTIDNSSEIIRDNEVVKYWKSHPTFKMSDGLYEKDLDGNYIVEKENKHYVPSTPQLATSLGLHYFYDYWFFDLNGHFFANSYLDMNPLYRTEFACSGLDGIATPEEIEYMAAQEKFDPVFLLNASVGKSWYIQRKYNIGFSLEVKNILNNRGVKTGGYEQTRLIDGKSGQRYYKFDSKYFYMQGINYMLNIYFRF